MKKLFYEYPFLCQWKFDCYNKFGFIPDCHQVGLTSGRLITDSDPINQMLVFTS
jgi:hypothetical protein